MSDQADAVTTAIFGERCWNCMGQLVCGCGHCNGHCRWCDATGLTHFPKPNSAAERIKLAQKVFGTQS